MPLDYVVVSLKSNEKKKWREKKPQKNKNYVNLISADIFM